MAVVSKSILLEAGVHFGHQTKRWNPKMKQYIFTARDEIHIINLTKTVEKLEEAYQAIKDIAVNGGTFLFVGTKKQASEVVKEEAILAWKKSNDLTFINCACRFTENVSENSGESKRQEMKELIKNLRKVNREIDNNIFKALDNINLNCVLGTKQDGNYKSFLSDYDNKK